MCVCFSFSLFLPSFFFSLPSLPTSKADLVAAYEKLEAPALDGFDAHTDPFIMLGCMNAACQPMTAN